jgi:adenylate cyclase
VEPNLEQFQVSAKRLGFFSTLRDRDGVVRRAPLVAQCGGELHVSLALALLESVQGRRAVVLGDREGTREIRLGSTSLATDEGGRVLINFRGPRGTFPHYSASDVLVGRVSREALAGKVVLIGATEIGIGDLQTTPFGTVFSGVEVLANVVDNLLAGNVLRRHDGLLFVELAALVLLGFLVSLVVPRLQNAAHGAGLVVALLILLVGATTYAFVAEGIWINLTYPALTLAVVYMAVAVTHGITVDARARMVRRRFETYVQPAVVNEMVNHPGSFRLGGERRDLSILFSDVRDFTTLAEEIGPDDVSRLLNEYLTPMTDIVLESRGTLDKYIGDAIVAFWGAPLPVEGHPVRACEAALAMQEEIARLRAERRDLAGVDRLQVGIGIHSGEVVVGNMGSDQRFDYTVTGDGVNLCSRLEGLTKFYGVSIIASSDLVGRVEGFQVRELDTIRAKGKKESVQLFEILGRDGAAALSPGLVETYAEGLRAYREGRWREAERALREALSASGGRDGPSALLLQRIEILEENPPSAWDGIWTFAEK